METSVHQSEPVRIQDQPVRIPEETDRSSRIDPDINLFQMEKMASIGQLSSSVAHEMRNLLG
nr:hypothetical protein [bacterium]